MYKRHTVNTPYAVGPVHLYTFEIDKDIIMFDTGPYTQQAMAYIKEKIDLKRLRYLFITHCHADHYGLENFIAKNSHAKIYLPYMDHLKFLNIKKRIAISKKLLEQYGFPHQLISSMADMLYDFINTIPLPINYEILEEEKWDIDLNYMLCPGHSKSDAVYLFEGFAITGDVILNNIYQTPLFDIDYTTMDRFNNYKAFCKTLTKLKELKNYTILPGHREHTSIEDIVTFYVLKTIDRASKLKKFMELSVYEIVKKVIPDALKDPFTAYIKTSEILFFLDFLKEPILLVESLNQSNLYNETIKKAIKSVL